MGTVLVKGSLFRVEKIAAPSPEWSEYCRQYAMHGNPEPQPFDDDEVRVIFFRQTMLGGYISSSRHLRYRSYIDGTDAEAKNRLDDITWNRDICNFARVVSINCLWRRQGSGLLGRLATMILYLWIMNGARFSDCQILAGAANSKLRKLYSTWNPVLSFSYRHHDGSIREMFLFHPDSAMAAITNSVSNLFLLKWLFPAGKQGPHKDSSESDSMGRVA